MVNPSDLWLGIGGFWVLSYTPQHEGEGKLFQLSECPTFAERACSSPTLFADARARRKTVLRVRFPSEALLERLVRRLSQGV